MSADDGRRVKGEEVEEEGPEVVAGDSVDLQKLRALHEITLPSPASGRDRSSRKRKLMTSKNKKKRSVKEEKAGDDEDNNNEEELSSSLVAKLRTPQQQPKNEEDEDDNVSSVGTSRAIAEPVKKMYSTLKPFLFPYLPFFICA